MSYMPQEKTFKKIGQSVEQAFAELDLGLDLMEQLENAGDEMERERLAALAGMHLHHSWHSMIRIFRRIARDVDAGVPKGTGAPKLLIDQMFQRTNERPNMLPAKHRTMVQKLSDFHRKFRNAQDGQYTRREVAELLDVLSDHIVPSVLESARMLAMAAPGGVKLVAHLHPTKGGAGTVEYEDRKTA